MRIALFGLTFNSDTLLSSAIAATEKPANAPMVSKWAVNGDTAPLRSRLMEIANSDFTSWA